MDVLFVSIPDYKIRNDGEINYDSFIAWKGNEYISSNFNSDEISIIERIGEELKYVIWYSNAIKNKWKCDELFLNFFSYFFYK